MYFGFEIAQLLGISPFAVLAFYAVSSVLTIPILLGAGALAARAS